MKTATDWLTDLSTGTASAFPGIKRTDVADGLRDRLAKPSRVDQANTSLCGAASLMYCLAGAKDAVYAQYVTELFSTGTGKLGSLTVKPGTDCKAYAATTTSGIHPVDWVTLASLRDSENDFFDYDGPSSETGGITMPGDLLDWFKQAGYSKDSNVTNLVLCKGSAELTSAGTKYGLGQAVCLFVNSNLLSSSSSGKGSSFPDHWIVLASPVTIVKGEVDISVFTWGGIRSVKMPTAQFCKNFYGFISASP